MSGPSWYSGFSGPTGLYRGTGGFGAPFADLVIEKTDTNGPNQVLPGEMQNFFIAFLNLQNADQRFVFPIYGKGEFEAKFGQRLLSIGSDIVLFNYKSEIGSALLGTSTEVPPQLTFRTEAQELQATYAGISCVEDIENMMRRDPNATKTHMAVVRALGMTIISSLSAGVWGQYLSLGCQNYANLTKCHSRNWTNFQKLAQEFWRNSFAAQKNATTARAFEHAVMRNVELLMSSPGSKYVNNSVSGLRRDSSPLALNQLVFASTSKGISLTGTGDQERQYYLHGPGNNPGDRAILYEGGDRQIRGQTNSVPTVGGVRVFRAPEICGANDFNSLIGTLSHVVIGDRHSSGCSPDYKSSLETKSVIDLSQNGWQAIQLQDCVNEVFKAGMFSLLVDVARTLGYDRSTTYEQVLRDAKQTNLFQTCYASNAKKTWEDKRKRDIEKTCLIRAFRELSATDDEKKVGGVVEPAAVETSRAQTAFAVEENVDDRVLVGEIQAYLNFGGSTEEMLEKAESEKLFPRDVYYNKEDQELLFLLLFSGDQELRNAVKPIVEKDPEQLILGYDYNADFKSTLETPTFNFKSPKESKEPAMVIYEGNTSFGAAASTAGMVAAAMLLAQFPALRQARLQEHDNPVLTSSFQKFETMDELEAALKAARALLKRDSNPTLQKIEEYLGDLAEGDVLQESEKFVSALQQKEVPPHMQKYFGSLKNPTERLQEQEQQQEQERQQEQQQEQEQEQQRRRQEQEQKQRWGELRGTNNGPLSPSRSDTPFDWSASSKTHALLTKPTTDVRALEKEIAKLKGAIQNIEAKVASSAASKGITTPQLKNLNEKLAKIEAEVDDQKSKISKALQAASTAGSKAGGGAILPTVRFDGIIDALDNVRKEIRQIEAVSTETISSGIQGGLETSILKTRAVNDINHLKLIFEDQVTTEYFDKDNNKTLDEWSGESYLPHRKWLLNQPMFSLEFMTFLIENNLPLGIKFLVVRGMTMETISSLVFDSSENTGAIVLKRLLKGQVSPDLQTGSARNTFKVGLTFCPFNPDNFMASPNFALQRVVSGHDVQFIDSPEDLTRSHEDPRTSFVIPLLATTHVPSTLVFADHHLVQGLNEKPRNQPREVVASRKALRFTADTVSAHHPLKPLSPDDMSSRPLVSFSGMFKDCNGHVTKGTDVFGTGNPAEWQCGPQC